MIRRFGWIAAAVSLAAQPLAADGTADPETAARLHAEAMTLVDEPTRWYDAAVLLERSAAELEVSDPRATETMRFAGHVFAQAGRYDRAQATLEAAGDLALARGDLAAAAHAFVQSAHAAALRGSADDARRLGWRVALIAESPLLSADEKSSVLGRIGALVRG